MRIDRRLGLLAILPLLALPTAASEAAAADASPYRLRLSAPADYRLNIDQGAIHAPFDQAVQAAARREHLDSALIHAVIGVESGYSPKAVSRTGAAGLMQLMPETARRFGVADPLSPDQNIRGGAAYLRQLLDRFDQKIDLALAAYNAGESAVESHGRKIPPYAETRRYVPAVTKRFTELKASANPYRLNPAALVAGHAPAPAAD